MSDVMMFHCGRRRRSRRRRYQRKYETLHFFLRPNFISVFVQQHDDDGSLIDWPMMISFNFLESFVVSVFCLSSLFFYLRLTPSVIKFGFFLYFALLSGLFRGRRWRKRKVGRLNTGKKNFFTFSRIEDLFYTCTCRIGLPTAIGGLDLLDTLLCIQL